MIKQKKHLYFLLFGLVFLLISGVFYYTHAATGTVSLDISGRGIRHGTPENFPIGTITASTNPQEVIGQFTEAFWVEDIQGYSTGHYTTIQCNGIYGPEDILLTGIELKAGNTNPELIMGSANPNIKINSLLHNYTSIIKPIIYIYKETNTSNVGLINKYGDKPRIKIDIPPTSPAGVYSGTIIFSFYFN